MKTITIEDHNFNVDSLQAEIKKGLTVEQFVQRGIHEGQFDLFDSTAREKLLKEAYERIRDFH